MSEHGLAVVPPDETEIGAAPEIPPLPPEPGSKPPSTTTRSTAKKPAKRRRRLVTRIASRASSLTTPSEPQPGAQEQTEQEPATEQEVVRAFWWVYRFWCRFLDSPLEAEQSDFQDLGEAWVGLMKKVPGIKVVLVFMAPALTLFEFLERMQVAFEKRKRGRPKPKQAAEQNLAEQPEVTGYPSGDQGAG